MTRQVIPESAVEAAAKAHQDLVAKGGYSKWDDLLDGGRETRRRNMRAALEAATPHMPTEHSHLDHPTGPR